MPRQDDAALPSLSSCSALLPTHSNDEDEQNRADEGTHPAQVVHTDAQLVRLLLQLHQLLSHPVLDLQEQAACSSSAHGVKVGLR